MRKLEINGGIIPMKVVVLCGSMKFFKEMQEIAINLETKHDYCVITPVSNIKELNNTELEKISKAHYKKIDISDAVYIVNIDGYIGESVSEELNYAQMHNKEIIYHEV